MFLNNFRHILLITICAIIISCNTQSTQYKPKTLQVQNVVQDTLPINISIYTAPDTSSLKNDTWGNMVKYGLRLVQNTPYYIGPQGVVNKNIKNKMSCNNCHLENGTKPYGANFFNSHKAYPQYRAREDKILTLADRVNNCIERPLSGTPLKLDCKEMVAIVSYIKWLGESYDEAKYEGYGLKHIDYKELSADYNRGEIVYTKHCVSCHQKNGEGKFKSDNSGYEYPPLWGGNSYQEGSSMHRVLKAASFIKYNMPNKTTWQNPVLTDQEALDVAAFINNPTHKRPKPKAGLISYPNIDTKPIDYFEGPYNDTFSQNQHAFGPWNTIVSFYQAKGLKVN